MYHRLLPVVSLGRDQQDTLGKTVALLWQLTLMFGPKLLPRLLERVRGILTDSGVERKIHTMINFLPDYYWFIKMPAPRGLRTEGRLMPRVLRSSGWRHTFDLVIKRGLSMLSFFPDFLTKLKAVVKFLRDKNLMETFTVELRRRGSVDAAEVLEVFHFPSFAKWRWSTLHGCVKPVSGIVHTLINYFDPELFRGMKDQTLFSTVLAALASPTWSKRELAFVAWFAAWLTPLQNYAG
eukprot:9470278-Pyramimonas_sp.AAC.1